MVHTPSQLLIVSTYRVRTIIKKKRERGKRNTKKHSTSLDKKLELDSAGLQKELQGSSYSPSSKKEKWQH